MSKKKHDPSKDRRRRNRRTLKRKTDFAARVTDKGSVRGAKAESRRRQRKTRKEQVKKVKHEE